MWLGGITRKFMCVSLKSKVIGSKISDARQQMGTVGGEWGGGVRKLLLIWGYFEKQTRGGCYTTWGMWPLGCHARRQMWRPTRHRETREPGFTTQWASDETPPGEAATGVCVCDWVPVWPRVCLQPWILDPAAVSSGLNITTKTGLSDRGWTKEEIPLNNIPLSCQIWFKKTTTL